MAVALIDLDGTLIDSGPVIFNAARHALTVAGLPVPEDLRPFVGPPLPIGMQTVLGVPEERVEELIGLYRAHQEAHLADTPVYEGMVEVCEDLRSRGWSLAIATSKFETVALKTTDALGLTGLFDVIAGGDEVSADKSVVISRALERLGELGLGGGASPIMVGDRLYDINGAHEHGLRSVFVRWGYGTPDEAQGADAVAEQPAELVRILADLEAAGE
ncbi:MAG TPA: HAD hydrolase-like protein [Actinomycetales bacterium]|nr:HAD hydrolase-like protein [Actinomycetales bacterium]